MITRISKNYFVFKDCLTTSFSYNILFEYCNAWTQNDPDVSVTITALFLLHFSNKYFYRSRMISSKF